MQEIAISVLPASIPGPTAPSPICLGPHPSVFLPLENTLGNNLQFMKANLTLLVAAFATKCHPALPPSEVGSACEGFLDQ